MNYELEPIEKLKWLIIHQNQIIRNQFIDTTAKHYLIACESNFKIYLGNSSNKINIAVDIPLKIINHENCKKQPKR